MVAKAMADKDWELAVKLRGRSFVRNLTTYKMLTKLKAPNKPDSVQKNVSPSSLLVRLRPSSSFFAFHIKYASLWGISTFLQVNLAIMCIGAPCGGINAAVRSFVRNGQFRGYKTFAIYDGIEGLAGGNVRAVWSKFPTSAEPETIFCAESGEFCVVFRWKSWPGPTWTGGTVRAARFWASNGPWPATTSILCRKMWRNSRSLDWSSSADSRYWMKFFLNFIAPPLSNFSIRLVFSFPFSFFFGEKKFENFPKEI